MDATLEAASWDLEPLIGGRGADGVVEMLTEARDRAEAFAQRHRGSVGELGADGLADAMHELAAIHDLGGGSGAMGRWLAPRLPGPQHWVVHDRDAGLLKLAVADAPGPASVTVEARRSDITRLTPGDLAGAEIDYREDIEGGHIQVLAEMIAGASAMPELGPEIASRMRPWITFTEEAVTRVMAGSSLGPLVPSGDLAFAIVSLYLGAAMLSHLTDDPAPAQSLFRTGSLHLFDEAGVGDHVGFEQKGFR